MSVTGGPATSYTYDSMSRLATVSDGARSAAYSRVSGSSLLASTTINNGTSNVLTVNRTYDILDRLTNITSNGVSYNYTYDNSDKRTRNTLSDGSYWLYEYDDLGQVTKGKKYTASGVEVVGQSFGYDYDDIGNLKTENRNGNVFKYTANSVNQYTERTVPSRINISGSADAASTVTIKQTSAGYTRPQRYGNYFNAFFNLDNSSNSVSDSFDIYAVKFDGTKDIVAHQTMNLFIPKTPEQFTYDNDGNLLSDGKFTYTWNGENRLISALETGKQKIDFIYDYQGRRINKKVYSWNGSAWVLDSEIKFVYDKYNIVAEFDGSNNLLNSYLWGEDLSGSLQGAGGVGGLLLVNDTAGVYLPIYDGNGNITTYLDNSGNTVATYEYDPFGKLICSFGTKADDMLYRFSTKYFDKETSLYYYGYRYYNPETSRWLSRDPIGETGGKNVYTFVDNSVVNWIDILGLAWEKKSKTTYEAGADGDSLEDLAKLVSSHKEDWVCIWPKTKECWENYPKAKKKAKADVSNLLNDKGSTFNIQMKYQDGDGYSAGMDEWITSVKATSGENAAERIKQKSAEGKTPIGELNIIGHHLKEETTIYTSLAAFEAGNLFKVATEKDNTKNTFDNALEKKGPPKCWFRRNGNIWGLGCNTNNTWMNDWATKVARKGITVHGTTDYLYSNSQKGMQISTNGAWYKSLKKLQGDALWATQNGTQ